MSADYRDRFGLAAHPFSKEFLAKHPYPSANVLRFQERFRWLLSEGGLGVLTGESGAGKTLALHWAARELPPHQYHVAYLEDSLAGPNDILRSLAASLGLAAPFRRSALWQELKGRMTKLRDENDQRVIAVIDEAHRLPPAFLKSLGALMNFLFDTREILTVWLAGDSQLVRTLSLAAHRDAMTRVRVRAHIEPLSREESREFALHCLREAGCSRQIVSDTALEAAHRLSQGLPRTAAKLLGLALRIAHEQGRDIICDRVIDDARREALL